MALSYKHIIFSIIALLAVQSQAQLYVQEGLKISEGTSLYVSGDVILASDTSLVNEGIVEANIQLENVKTLDVQTESEQVLVKSPHSFDKKDALSITYINIAAKSYQTDSSNSVLEYKELTISEVDYTSFVLQDNFNLNLSQTTDYILPIIYSYTFYKRFTEDAQLYEFEHPYASLRPPIV